MLELLSPAVDGCPTVLPANTVFVSKSPHGAAHDAQGYVLEVAPHSQRLQGLVFLTILMTVGLQGLTAQPLAHALGLVKANDDELALAEATAQSRQVLTDTGQQ